MAIYTPPFKQEDIEKIYNRAVVITLKQPKDRVISGVINACGLSAVQNDPLAGGINQSIENLPVTLTLIDSNNAPVKLNIHNIETIELRAI